MTPAPPPLDYLTPTVLHEGVDVGRTRRRLIDALTATPIAVLSVVIYWVGKSYSPPKNGWIDFTLVIILGVGVNFGIRAVKRWYRWCGRVDYGFRIDTDGVVHGARRHEWTQITEVCGEKSKRGVALLVYVRWFGLPDAIPCRTTPRLTEAEFTTLLADLERAVAPLFPRVKFNPKLSDALNDD